MDVKQTTQRGGPAERHARRAQIQAQAQDAQEPDVDRIRAFAAQIAAVPTRLGVDVLAADEGGTLEVVVDPEALGFGRTFRRILKEDPDVTKEVATAVKRLSMALDQQQRMEAIAAAADQIDADLADTDRFAARQEADCQAAFYRVLGGLLSGAIGDLTPAQRDRLKARAKEVLRLKEEEQAESAAERKLTQAASRDAQAAVEAGERQAQLLRTRRDLRDDRPVPPEDLDAAIETYAELGGTTPPTGDDSSGRRRSRR